MRKRLLIPAFFFYCTMHCSSQTTTLAEWPKLIDSHKCEAAKRLCMYFEDSRDISQRVESQKCLANVALCGHDVVLLQGDNGGGTLSSGYSPEAVDEALVHLDLGLKLAPQDISIHQGRLHVLEASARYSDMVRALDESCSIYKGSDALQAWLAYAAELADLRQSQDGLAFMRVLDKHYPNSPDVLANIGAFLSMLKKPAEAIPYLQKAVQLAPKDPINVWDLGKAYDLTGQIELADKWYQEGLSLQTETGQLAESSCLYARFVEQKLHDRARACSLERKDCSVQDQTACTPPTAPTKQDK